MRTKSLFLLLAAFLFLFGCDDSSSAEELDTTADQTTDSPTEDTQDPDTEEDTDEPDEVEDLSEDTTDTEDEVCMTDCNDKECGDDGCGGTCGTCDTGFQCNDSFVCEEICLPDCDGKECGVDGCGDTCGVCDNGYECSESFTCEEICVPNCDGVCCGDDGCGNPCPDTCGDGYSCDTLTCGCVEVGCQVGGVTIPECSATIPGPTTDAEIDTWIVDNAVPLACDDNGTRFYDFDILVQDFDAGNLFMFGEVHGTAQLGPLSAEVFEHLVRQGLINGLTMEFGYDTTEAMQTYVETGDQSALNNDFSYDYYADDMFIKTLLVKARALKLEGYDINVFGSDIPMSLAMVTDDIAEIGARLVQNHDLVVGDLPPAPSSGSWPPLSYYNNVDAYRTSIQDSLTEICDEYGDQDECDKLAVHVDALWATAFSQSEKFYYATADEMDLFWTRREGFIIYNYIAQMPTENERVFTHMGSAHTSLSGEALGGEPSTGQYLYESYGPTQGDVYSTTPAYASGSSILYGGWTYDLEDEPQVVADALGGVNADIPFYLSTRRPGLDDCSETPLSNLDSTDGLFHYPTAYHSYIFIKRLTPEGNRALPTDPKARMALEFQQRLFELDNQRLGKGR